MKYFESDFRHERGKVTNVIKKGLENCNVGANPEVANCVAMLSNHLADFGKVDANEALESETLLDGEAFIDAATNYVYFRSKVMVIFAVFVFKTNFTLISLLWSAYINWVSSWSSFANIML